MINEREIDSLKFEWAIAQSNLQRLETKLKELRITALVMSVVVFASVAGFFGGPLKIPSSSMRVVLLFGSIWWGMTYVSCLVLPTYMRYFKYHDDDMAFFSVDMDRFDNDISFKNQAKLLENTRYQVMRLGRVVRINTQLVAFGVAMTMITFGVSIMFGWH